MARPPPTRGHRRGAARPPRRQHRAIGQLVSAASSSCVCARGERRLPKPNRSRLAGLSTRWFFAFSSPPPTRFGPATEATSYSVIRSLRGPWKGRQGIFKKKKKVIKVSRFPSVSPTSCNSRQWAYSVFKLCRVLTYFWEVGFPFGSWRSWSRIYKQERGWWNAIRALGS